MDTPARLSATHLRRRRNEDKAALDDAWPEPMPSSGARRAPLEDAMPNGQPRRLSRNLQRRIRAHQLKSGKPYLAAAEIARTEQALGRRYLSDPAAPAELAAAVRDAGLIPLEPLNRDEQGHWNWWCRCSRCGLVISVCPDGHGYQRPGRSPYHLHDSCEMRKSGDRRD